MCSCDRNALNSSSIRVLPPWSDPSSHVAAGRPHFAGFLPWNFWKSLRKGYRSFGASCHFWALQLPCHSDISSCFLSTCTTWYKCVQGIPLILETQLKASRDSRIFSEAWVGDKANVNSGLSVCQDTCICAGVYSHRPAEWG